MEFFEKSILGISPEEVVLGLAIVLQGISIGRHFRLGEFSGWLKPFRIYAIMVSLMMVPRVLSQLGLYGWIAPATARGLDSVIFLVNSALACWAPWALMKEIRGLLLFNLKMAAQAAKAAPFSKPALIDAIPDGLVQIDLDGNILSANKALCDLVHYSEKELIGRPLSALLLQILTARQILPVEISVAELETEEGKQLVGLIRKITKRR